MLPVEQREKKPSDWFKPVPVQTCNENNDLMEFEEDIDVDTVNCDEIEEGNEDNRDEVDDDVSDGKQGEGDECDVQNANEAQSDVTTVEVGDEHDILNANEAQSDVTTVEVGDEHDIHNANEAQSDVTTVEVGDEHDIHNANEAQSDVITVEVGDECDIQNANEAQSDVDTDDSVVEVFVEEYESSEYESDYNNSQLYPPEIPTVLSDEDENLSFNWNGILTYTMSNALKCYVQCTQLHEVLPIVKYMVYKFDIIDTIDKHFYPDKDSPSNYLPVETIGNGNCGYRALGHVLLSDQNRHYEVRELHLKLSLMKNPSCSMPY